MWGNCQLELMSFKASKSAYDLALDIVDNRDGDCLLMLVTREDIYKQADANLLMTSYEALVKSFAIDPDIPISQPSIYQAAEIGQAMGSSRG